MASDRRAKRRQPGLWAVVAILLVAAATTIGLAAATGAWNVVALRKTSSTVSRDGFTVRLSISRVAVPAGTSIPAALIITNGTGRPIPFFWCLEGSLAVGVASPTIPYDPAFAESRCTRTLQTGRNVVPVSILTTYQGCGGSDSPPCGSSSEGPPALPPGLYSTATVWGGGPLDLPHPPPIAVAIT